MPVLPTFVRLAPAEPEALRDFFMAAVYWQAIHTGQSPRNVVDALFKAMPSSESWPAMRDALLSAVEDDEGEST